MDAFTEFIAFLCLKSFSPTLRLGVRGLLKVNVRPDPWFKEPWGKSYLVPPTCFRSLWWPVCLSFVSVWFSFSSSALPDPQSVSLSILPQARGQPVWCNVSSQRTSHWLAQLSNREVSSELSAQGAGVLASLQAPLIGSSSLSLSELGQLASPLCAWFCVHKRRQ